jgi:hypothetical protein
MTEIVETRGKAIQRSLRRPTLTKDEMFRLWRAAIKDDDRLADAMIQTVYDGMMAFDSERAGVIVELTVRRNPTAGSTFGTLLKDIQACQGPGSSSASRVTAGASVVSTLVQ